MIKISVTGQVGHIALAKQSAKGSENTTAGDFVTVKLTGDSLVAANNMLVAEGEIGTGRDVSGAVPGGFSAAGAINGNLRVQSVATLMECAFGTSSRTVVAAGGTGATANVAYDEFLPQDSLPYLTIEKRVGAVDPEQLILHYTDAFVNTLNISATSGGFGTFSAGIVAAGEKRVTSALVTPSYPAAKDDLLVFHGGRIRAATAGTTPLTASHNDPSFQSFEVVLNNNVDATEYTIRPSRFLRDLTEGIRSVEANMTIVFDNFDKYQKYSYGATGNNAPGYSLYLGTVEFLMANWQIADADQIILTTLTSTGNPANPQAFQLFLDNLAFSGFPVALQTGRIAVTTTARALKKSANIVKGWVRPSLAGFQS